MSTIRESELPGIGHKFLIETNTGDKLIVIVHGDGLREIYQVDPNDPERCTLIAQLQDSEARQIAGIVGGLVYKPRAIEEVEMALEDLIVEWHRVRPGAPAIGRTIGELDVRRHTGASIVAMVGPQGAKRINPGPDETILADTTLVIIGERPQIRALRRLLTGEA